jgi:hypothetical protein
VGRRGKIEVEIGRVYVAASWGLLGVREKGDGLYVFCISLSGRITPEEKMAPADLAVP